MPAIGVLERWGFAATGAWDACLSRSATDGIRLAEEVWAPFANPRAHLQLLFPIALGGVWDYPLPQVRPVVEACMRRIGAHRLMWGTDMPIVLRFWTYRQNVDFIRRYCDFLGPAEIDAIMGDTAAALLGVT